MARIKYSYKIHKKAVECTGKMFLSCGHKLVKTIVLSTKSAAIDAVEKDIEAQLRKHECDNK
jgi:hypothetical protein